MIPRPDPGTNRLLGGLPEIDRQRWLAHLEPVELSCGQVLYEAGQVPLHGYFPTTAVVSLVYMTEVGECDEVAVVGREGVVGVSAFMGGRSTPGTAVVQRRGWAFRLRARMLKEEFQQVPAVMHVLLDYTLALSVQVAQTAVCNRHHMLDQRLCRRLLQGLDRQQEDELAITQGQLAGLLGVRRESITMEALKLQKAGVVRYSRGHIFVLDRAALERGACECYGVVKKEFDRAAPATHLSVASAGGGLALGTTPSAASAGLATHFQRMREQARRDLARQLHDELGAVLNGARLEVATLKARLVGATTDVQQRLKHLSETINSGIAFAERVVQGPDPSLLATAGLSASLGILAREFGSDCGISIAADLDEADVDVATQLTVYLVAQESLSNVCKYARANDTRIVLLDCGREILMTVRDNGHGFDTAAVGRSSHGLAGMRHRVESCGGEFTVTSEAGRGTLIAAVLPKQPGAVGAAHEHSH